ncbi:hypothetical protein ACRQDJ_02910 [Actinotignum sp. GS-2025g]|uniref:hypothetical protein n=1 Tax=Actinotignum sp. GS-2025g TaxID=3427280 RepID=UPI003F446234
MLVVHEKYIPEKHTFLASAFVSGHASCGSSNAVGEQIRASGSAPPLIALCAVSALRQLTRR